MFTSSYNHLYDAQIELLSSLFWDQKILPLPNDFSTHKDKPSYVTVAIMKLNASRLWQICTVYVHSQQSLGHLGRVEYFVGILKPTCCNIFIFNRIIEMF
jgi:hypothetical protein